jgi:hypothetical protein
MFRQFRITAIAVGSAAAILISLSSRPFLRSAAMDRGEQRTNFASVLLDQDERIDISRSDPESVARRDFMRTKLNFTQNIFGGLVVSDFAAVNRAIDDVESITRGEQWLTIDSEAYRKLTDNFIQSVAGLRKAAKTKNIEATALRFYDLSTRCIDCHQLIHYTDDDL